MSSRPIKVYADRRWPLDTGIGKVQFELEARRPQDIDITDIHVPGKIGSPFSPLAITRALPRRAPGSVFFSAGFVPPLYAAIPSVVIVHDLTHRRFYGAAKRAYYDLVYRPLYRRCSAVICVSEFTRAEFLEWSGMAAERVHLVYNGCEPIFTEEGEAFAPGYDYVVYCGNHRPYKNLARLIRAYAASGLPGRGIKLAFTGNPNPELVAVAGESGVGQDLVFLGRLPSETIPAVYRGARAIAYVSLFEGFGLPIVEAFSCGVPVMTSNISAMPEVAADGALLVDPESVEEMSAGLDRITSDEALRSRLIANGRRRREDFNWDVSAKRVWDIVRNTAT